MGRLSEIVQRVEAISLRPSRAVARGLRRFRFGRALVHVFEQCVDGPLVHNASAMSFDMFLGSIPLLALAGWLFGRLLMDDSALRAVSLLLGSTPVQVQGLAREELTRYSAEMLAPLAIAGALWLGSSACVTCMQYLEEREPGTRRSWWQRRLWAFAWVTGSVLVFGLGSTVVFTVVGGPVRMLESLVSQRSVELTSYALALGLLYGLAMLLLAGFYRIVLHTRGTSRAVFLGAALAIGVSGLASFGFALYVARLARYALYYGSLAAVAITMAWLWLLCFFVLAGAEFLISYDEGRRR
jgi:membrane protein